MEASPSHRGEPLPEVRVGIREIRHDFRSWMERARAGERIVVTDRGAPVAEMGPYRDERSWLQRMYDEGLIVRATKPLRVMWHPDDPITTVLSDTLREMREEDDR